MSLPFDELIELASVLETEQGISLLQSPRTDRLGKLRDRFEEGQHDDLFRQLNGLDVPKSISALLSLPDTLDLVWQSEDGGGECHLLEPNTATSKRIDPSFAGMVDLPVTEMLLLDQVTDITGPYFVLYTFESVEKDGLYLFDGREIATLTLTPTEYVEALALGGGFDSWQYLFSSLPILPDRRSAMEASFSVIANLFPERDLSIFSDRFSRG